jgi:hypothetical protein
VSSFVEVLCGVLAYGRIAAADVATRTALAKFHPASAIAQTFLTGSWCAWSGEISFGQSIQMCAQHIHGFLLQLRSVVIERHYNSTRARSGGGKLRI